MSHFRKTTTMHLRAEFACLLLVLFVACGCESISSGMSEVSDGRKVVTVFAAASTTNAMEEIRKAFERETGIAIQTNYAASSTLAQQIVNGAEADVFVSANVGWADHVESESTKRRNLLGNRLVMIAPSDSQLDLGNTRMLLREEVEHLALADTDSVPAGKYAKQALGELDLWNDLKGKVVAGKDVRQALMFVETGAAQAGIVYATDAAVSNRVKVVAEIPINLTDPVVYPALLLTHPADNSRAERFYEFLGSPEATRIFEEYGFVSLAGTENETDRR